MSLTKRERAILSLAHQGLSDYKIAHKLKVDPPTVSRSHKNARKKLVNALIDIGWAKKIGMDLSQLECIEDF